MSDKIIAFPDFEAHQEEWPLIPEGTYEMRLVSHEVRFVFQQHRLVLQFRICDFGDYFGTVLYRFYNIERCTKSNKGKVKSIVHKPRGDFMIEYCNLFPDAGRVRRDRVSMERLYDKVIIGTVVTVKKNNQNKPLPPALQYSKVGCLLRIAK